MQINFLRSSQHLHTINIQSFYLLSNFRNKGQQNYKSSFTFMIIYDLFWTVFGCFLANNVRGVEKIGHPLIMTLWFWYPYFQIDIGTITHFVLYITT